MSEDPQESNQRSRRTQYLHHTPSYMRAGTRCARLLLHVRSTRRGRPVCRRAAPRWLPQRDHHRRDRAQNTASMGQTRGAGPLKLLRVGSAVAARPSSGARISSLPGEEAQAGARGL
eukprot:3232940-Prymnesium_polylepis.2